MRIIDIHTHPIFFGEGNSEPEANELARYAQSLGIEAMVALGDVLLHGPNPDAAQIHSINDATYQLSRWVPGYYIPFCYLNPTLGEKALRQELELRLEQGFKGIKLEIANNARSPVMKPLMQAAREAQIPVLQHTWDTLDKAMRKTHSDPADTCYLARQNPDVSIIMAHLYGFGRRGVIEAIGLDNLYIDTSSCLPFSGLLEFAVETLGDQRILYGSDIPIRELGQCIGRITGSKISDVSKSRILYENAQTLLNKQQPSSQALD